MHFSNEAEALLAIATLVVSADQVGTSPEQEHLFDHVGALQPFGTLNATQFNDMLDSVNAQLFSTGIPFDELMKPDGISQFCKAVRVVLPDNRVDMALQIACDIAYADGILHVERSLLEQLASGLGMSPDNLELLVRNYENQNSY